MEHRHPKAFAYSIVRIYKSWLILVRELYELSEPNKAAPYLGEMRRRKLYGCIVFLAFALESFINEIGIEYCKEDFKLLDRLPAVTKWQIIPKLNSRNLFKKNEEPFISIKEIFQLRNTFAHYKPQFKDMLDPEFRKLKQVDHKLVRRLYKNTIKAMRAMATAFDLVGSDWLSDYSDIV